MGMYRKNALRPNFLSIQLEYSSYSAITVLKKNRGTVHFVNRLLYNQKFKMENFDKKILLVTKPSYQTQLPNPQTNCYY